jgi:hypothetical protein
MVATLPLIGCAARCFLVDLNIASCHGSRQQSPKAARWRGTRIAMNVAARYWLLARLLALKAPMCG